MPGPFCFAWIASGDVAFDPVTHAVYDEIIFDVSLSHSEGDHATWHVTARNPKVGLLGSERFRWAIISWHNGTDLVPLCKGRIIGVQTGISGELVQLEFIARPDDYEDRKASVADSLRVLPRYDEVWFQQSGTVNNDAVLEPYSALWYIDRVDLSVGTSDIINGEAGTIELTAADHEYDGLDVTYGEKPIKRVRGKFTVTWTQEGEGLVDLTDAVTVALRQGGSPYSYPGFTSLTSDGLVSSWPKKDESIGEGWTVFDSSITNFSRPTTTDEKFPNLGLVASRSGYGFFKPYVFEVDYFAYTPEQLAATQTITIGGAPAIGNAWLNPPAEFVIDFPVPTLSGTLVAKWRASRKRTETISFALEADLQELDNDLSLQATEEAVELTSDFVGKVVDSFSLSTTIILVADSADAILVSSQDLIAGTVYIITSDHVPFGTTFVAPADAGAENLAITMSDAATETVVDGESCTVETDGAYPIGDLRRNAYFTLDRGKASLECGLYICRAKLLAKSRAIEIKMKPLRWIDAVAITLRHNITVHDDRLPGGVATGKVTSIELGFADGAYQSVITIKCPVGKGNTLASPTEGTGTYASPGYMRTGYQTAVGATVSLDVGDLQYEDYTAAAVTDDDGVDLFHMTADTVIKSLVVTNGLNDQCRLALANAGNTWNNRSQYGDPLKAVEANPTTVDLKLVSMTGEFLTVIFPTVSKLMIPRSIDLEAA